MARAGMSDLGPGRRAGLRRVGGPLLFVPTREYTLLSSLSMTKPLVTWTNLSLHRTADNNGGHAFQAEFNKP